jgi:hypothetical protein
MNREQAQAFFRDHSEWLANSWGMTPEGRAYKTRFDMAVKAIVVPDAPPTPDVTAWKHACAALLRQPRSHGWREPNLYVQAIKLTRNTFGCTLIDGKNRVDALRAELNLTPGDPSRLEAL